MIEERYEPIRRTQSPWRADAFLLYAVWSTFLGSIVSLGLVVVAALVYEGDFNLYRRTLSNLATPHNHYSAPIMTTAFVLTGTVHVPLVVYQLKTGMRDAGRTARAAYYLLIPVGISIVSLAVFTDLRPTLLLHRACAGLAILGIGIHLLLMVFVYLRTAFARPVGVAFGVFLLAIVLAWLLRGTFGYRDGIPEAITCLAGHLMMCMMAYVAWVYGPIVRDDPAG